MLPRYEEGAVGRPDGSLSSIWRCRVSLSSSTDSVPYSIPHQKRKGRFSRVYYVLAAIFKRGVDYGAGRWGTEEDAEVQSTFPAGTRLPIWQWPQEPRQGKTFIGKSPPSANFVEDLLGSLSVA